MASLRGVIRDQLDENNYAVECIGLQEQKSMVENILQGVIENQHSDSFMLVGAPGTGKSLLLQQILSNLHKTHKGKLIEIRLNGLLHSDPRVGCQHILESMGNNQAFGSFEAETEKIINLFEGKNKTIIVILDKLDLFANLYQGKQSLLYFLFDLLHNPRIYLCIVCMTNRYDCISLLEKRVISRFSQLQIRFYTPAEIEDYLSLIKSRLLIPTTNSQLPKKTIQEYNESVNVLFRNDLSFFSIVERMFLSSKSPRKCLDLLVTITIVKLYDTITQFSIFSD